MKLLPAILRPAILGSAMALTAFALVSPAVAQNAGVEDRVKKLEKEIRAVQRKVFPGGAGRFFEPEIAQESSSNNGTANAPTTSAVTDLIARVDSLEAQLAGLTGQVEQQGNSIRTMEARLAALEGGTSSAGSSAETSDSAPALTDSSASSDSVVTSSDASIIAAPATGAAAIERPDSGDAGEDAYIYGYRLWAAKFYPEARTQLKSTADKYPSHRRGSFARNLEGRSWLDDNKPATAAKIFYANYKDYPRGERAPDSLYFLGVSLTRLGKNTEACAAFDQLETAYPGDASSRLANRLASGRSQASCS